MELTKAKEVCPTTTQGLIKEGALLVDVREWNEVKEVAFDVPNIMVIPLSEFEERYQEIPKDKEVVLVCQVGVRSLKATYYLMNHGYTNVMNMQYGMERWLKKGFPTKGNPSASLNKKSSSGCCGAETSAEASETKTSQSSCCEPSSSNGSSCC